MSDFQNQFYDPLLAKDQNKYPKGIYNPFPTYPLENEEILSGFDSLSEIIHRKLNNGLRVLVIDGFQGVDWLSFKDGLKNSLNKLPVKSNWIDISECLATKEEISKRAEPFMGGDDRIFGTHYPFGPEIFFSADKIAPLRIKASISRAAKSGDLTIIYGCGSGLIELWDQLWYLDFPKDLAQEHARQGKISNFGEDGTTSFEQFYKRTYFVEWPALNRLKRQLLPEVNLLIDAQNSESPTAITGPQFRVVLKQMSENPIRLRPWFYPGPWGGKYMQGHMDLDKDQPNFAWSFEMIVPENGLVIEKDNKQLEFSFDFLMFQENKRVMGEQAANQFKYEWPIRLDYLDTVDGGNLSTQVHPKPDYMRRNFGETFTQDETYYIITAKPGARVYLGLTDSCDPQEFKKALQTSMQDETMVDIDKYVNSEASKAHDLFLIPNGTVHCSGEGNLVLEISATPYIFTFKIYDYLRRDLEGNLRPLNIERGFDNIRFERREKWVKENLIAKPEKIAEGPGWQKYMLYDNPFTFYTISRVEFETEYEMNTENTAYAVNLVEGERIEILSNNGRRSTLAYIESMLIPAAAGKIKMVNKGRYACKLIMVCIKPGIGISEAVNDPQDG